MSLRAEIIPKGRLYYYTTFCLAFLVSVNSLSVSRRRLFYGGAAMSTACVTASNPDSASAARGAAELDFEYYMRDLVGGNRREGNILPSKSPPVPPPRILTNPLLGLLLNDDCSSDCLPTLALIETLIKPEPGIDPRFMERDIMRRVDSYREKSSKSFYARAPWKKESVTDQHYFDLTAYALWRTAADLLPNFKDRDAFLRRLGRFIYGNAKKYKILSNTPIKQGSAVGTIDSITEILDMFTNNQFCKGYRLGESVTKKEDGRPLFDDFDDDAIQGGATTDCLVSVLESATLGSSLQITGEQSRFVPDFIGPTLAAMWETAGIQATSWETYFVDAEYRPNPKDYFPNEQIFQFTLAFANKSKK